MSRREDTTTFEDGACAQCGWRAYSQDENGPACDLCGRRVVIFCTAEVVISDEVERW